MMKIFSKIAKVALAGLLACAAQLGHAQTFKANNIDLSGSITFNGAQGMRIGPTSIYNPSMFAGPHAGESYPKANPWTMGFGPYSLQLLNIDQAEVTAFGPLSGFRLKDGNYDAIYGLHALGADPHASGASVFGVDASRNSIGGNNYAFFGFNAGRNGNTDLSAGFGAGALRGNSSSLTFGGTPTAGDVIAVTMSCTATPQPCSNGPVTWTYTVKSSDTLKSIATAFIGLMNATPIHEIGDYVVLQADAPQMDIDDAVVRLDFTGTATTGWYANISYTLSSGATETVTVGTGTVAQGVVAAGAFAVDGARAGFISNSNFYGFGIAPSIKSVSEVNCFGHGACNKMETVVGQTAMGESALAANKTGLYNTAFGAHAGESTTGQNNTYLGGFSGAGVTTGNDNTTIGSYAGDTTSRNCITTGSGNVQIGRLACVPDPTKDGQLSIQNIIYCTANNGSGSTASQGFCGIGVQNPLTKLDVDGAMRTKVYTVDTLPIGVAGMRAFVGDAQACSFGQAVTGGGSLGCPVYFDNLRWVAGG